MVLSWFSCIHPAYHFGSTCNSINSLPRAASNWQRLPVQATVILKHTCYRAPRKLAFGITLCLITCWKGFPKEIFPYTFPVCSTYLHHMPWKYLFYRSTLQQKKPVRLRNGQLKVLFVTYCLLTISYTHRILKTWLCWNLCLQKCHLELAPKAYGVDPIILL